MGQTTIIRMYIYIRLARAVSWSLQYNAVSEISGVSVFSINRVELNGMYIYIPFKDPLAPNGKEYW